MRKRKKTLTISSLSITFSESSQKKDSIKPIPKVKSFITKHEITNGGKLIKYNAIASETYLKNKTGVHGIYWTLFLQKRENYFFLCFLTRLIVPNVVKIIKNIFI